MLITWSGGCDSTFLLLKYLMEGKNVRTLSVTHDQVPQSNHEKEARIRIRNALMKRGLNFSHHEMTISGDGITLECGQGGMHQPAIWLSAAIGHLQDKEDLHLGYVKEDDFWHYRQWYWDAFQNLKVICNKSGTLVFPLEWTEKKE